MNKILLGTTALVANTLISLPMLAAGSHTHIDNVVTNSDSALSISLGGIIDFQAGFDDVSDGADISPDRDIHFRNDTEINVTVSGKTDSGLEYGAIIELEADVTLDADNEGINADKTYLFLQGAFGRVELGNNSSASQTLKVDAATIARATGGIDGDYSKYIHPDFPYFTIATPDLPTAYQKGDSEDATKISYYSPRISGFQFGASYTPDNFDAGSIVGSSSTAADSNYEDIFNVGVNYAKNFENWSLLASLTGEFGDNVDASKDDLSAYHAGIVVSTGGFSIAAGYSDWDDSFTNLFGNNDDASFWNVGISYERGPWGVSLTYLDGEIGDNESQTFSLGADYQIASGLVSYAEYTTVDIDSPFGDSSADIFIIGTTLSF